MAESGQLGKESTCKPSGRPQAYGDTEIDLHDLIFTIWKHKSVTIGIFLIFMSLMSVYLQTVPPRYSAQALLIIEPEKYTPPALKDMLQNQPINFTVVINESEVLKSKKLARQVMRRLGMIEEKEIPDISESETSPQDRGFSDFRTLKIHEYEYIPEEATNPEVNNAVAGFLKKLTVRPLPGSFIIQITYTSKDPELSALVANTLANV